MAALHRPVTRLHHSELVWPATNGGRRDKGEPHWWKDAVRAAGIDRNVRWHDLRHTCASSLIAGWWGRKWSLEEVKEMLGHASITTTERYAHLAESEIQKAAKETAGMPDVGPAALEISEPTAGATLGIRIPDLRFTKACETVEPTRSSQIESPVAGYQDSAGSCGVTQLTDTSPAGDREGPALLPGDPPNATFAAGYMGDPAAWCYWDAEYPEEGSCGPFASRAEAVDHAVASGMFNDDEPSPFTAADAMGWRLNQRLLQAAMRDVLARQKARVG